MGSTDEQLISRYLKEGEEISLEILITRYLKPVFGFISRYIADAAAAEDITQETFVKAWKNLKKYDPEKNFKTWLFSIARNSSIDYLRKKKSLVFSDFEDGEQGNYIIDTLADPAPLPEELLLAGDFKAEMDRALDQLPTPSRTVLLLHLQDQLTFKEIAGILQQPIDTVKSRYRRGLLNLRKILNFRDISLAQQASPALGAALANPELRGAPKSPDFT